MIALLPQKNQLSFEDKEILMRILFGMGIETNLVYEFSSIHPNIEHFLHPIQRAKLRQQIIVIFTNTDLIASIISIKRIIKESTLRIKFWIIFDNGQNPWLEQNLQRYGKLINHPPAIPAWIHEQDRLFIFSADPNRIKRYIDFFQRQKSNLTDYIF